MGVSWYLNPNHPDSGFERLGCSCSSTQTTGAVQAKLITYIWILTLKNCQLYATLSSSWRATQNSLVFEVPDRFGKVEPGVWYGWWGPFFLLHLRLLLFLWLTDLPCVLKIPGEQSCRDGDETASLTLSHRNPSLHRLPASICLQLAPPNNPHCLSTHHPSQNWSPVTGSDTLPAHTPTQSPILSFSLSSRPSLQVWAFKTSAVINHCQIQPNHSLAVSHKHTLFFLSSSLLCPSLCHPISPSPSSSPRSLFQPPSSASSLTLAQICST